ncbi:PREDICTED: treslin [Chrysochloris asiatica]|uniref:Treslin n=1 Tax=Chrysochloris asiatica TaxID=185453 RepID=A0A9B0TT83_CHRAS|nr:PREDICTED: treslin [Chrysochloris asiatica]
MACCHKVMMLVDTAGGAARQSPVRRAALRLLTYLSCRFGLGRVHWAFKFFDSQGARSRPSRGSDFRELGARSWEDFEEELEARLGDLAHGAHLPGPAPRATLTHSALMETLLDYQWDRPEITSPTKPFLRSRGRRLLDVESEAKEAESALGGGFVNAVFLLAPCPRSHRELLQFLAGCEAQAQTQPLPPTPKQVMEKLLPKRVQEVMIARKITLYWVDTIELAKLWESPDHVGFQTVCEILHNVGGTVLPLETFSQDFPKAGRTQLSGDIKLSNEHQLSPWTSTLPTDSTLNRLLYNSREYGASFPQIEGTLLLPIKGKENQETCAVTLEPLTVHQSHFQKPVRIVLKGTVAQWAFPMSGVLGTDSWMLQSPIDGRSSERVLFQQLARKLIAEELHLVASVDPGEGWPPITGVISPLSASATTLTVFRTEDAEFQRHFLQRIVAESPRDTAPLLSDITNDVMKQIQNSLKDPASPVPVPEWAQQELGRTVPWSAAVLDKWFPFSNFSGASSNLMESFWLLQAASANKEKSCKTENELTRCLSEFYQRKFREESAAASQEDSKRKRGVPRTPVRQKMNTMCRSLKMLNVARFNVKAQKLQPDGSPDMAGEKGSQKTAGGRTADKLEDRGRTLRSSKLKDFNTEEELLSHLQENYQQTVATGEIPLCSCAQNMIAAFKAFLKSKGTKELEMNCLNRVKENLFKTSKSLRQNLGKKLDKEAKVRECQLQVFLRLEMCLQCPLIQDSTDNMEQVVEEVTDLLRMVCLTEDPAYLSKFLEEILELYIDSIPKTLGNLYYSLGFAIPQRLAGVLPTDFFSDDSMTQDSKSPDLSVPLLTNTHRSVSDSTESDQLEELRTRSAKKRRKNALIRHKSIAEVSQNLRQIEIPKVSRRAAKHENSHSTFQQAPVPVKDAVQEVTKVRRNLFNQKMLSPSKRSLKRGLPRSHSVSAVEGLEYKPDNFRRTKDYHKLLTKSVAETPEHKQISKRLLHRQIKGRSSDPGPDTAIVEESPEKEENELSLRRSPRIKQLLLNRTHSGFFYSASQPKSRSVQRVHSFQYSKSDQRENSPAKSIRSPKRLLFGAMSEMTSPSEKVSAQIQRPSRTTLDSDVSTTYQTPKKSSWKSPRSSQVTPRKRPPTPQTPYYTPERRLESPAETTPTTRAAWKESLRNPSSYGCDSPSELAVTPRKQYSLAEGLAAPLEKIPRTPKRHAAQPPEILQACAWSQSVPSSPESILCPAPTVHTGLPHHLRTPSKSATFVGMQQNQRCESPRGPGASPAEDTAETLKGKAIRTSKTLENTPTISSPPISPKEPFNSASCTVSMESPRRKPVTDSPPPRELDWSVPQESSHGATSLSCPVPSTSPRISQTGTSGTLSPLPPSKITKRCQNPSNPERSFPECQPTASRAPVVGFTEPPATVTDSRRDHKEGSLSLQSPERHSYPGVAEGTDWNLSSPLLIADDTDYLLDENEHDSDLWKSNISPEQDEVLGALVTDKPPSLSHPGIPPSPPSSRPSSPLEAPCGVRCLADRKPGQSAAQPENEQALTQASKSSGGPQTYEVELEMQASGLPRLRIKKRESRSVSDAVPLRKEDICLGEDSAFPGLPSARASRPSGRPEASYTSPPCLRSSHSTPGKSGGQTYICQSCTPTRCPPSTPSPFQAEVGVPWTPSPKHNGKTPPDVIKDWPRRKRAADGSSNVGRSEVCAELLGSGAGLQLEGKEPGFEPPLSKTCILGDFELEGVCQLPDLSPPRNIIPKAEDTSWGQFGLGSRKRLLCAQEEAQCWAKRVCDSQREDSEASVEKSPSASVGQLPSTGDEEVFVSGSTPPSSCIVRSCLSASGLQALTQSPLLFQGRTPSSQHKDAPDEDVDVFSSTAEESPFSRAFSRRRPISRTYTRKKLMS